MKQNEIIDLVESNRTRIVDELREADISAMFDAKSEFCVALYRDGRIETRCRPVGCTLHNREDRAVVVFGDICNQAIDFPFGLVYGNDLTEIVISHLNNTERKRLEKFIEKTGNADCRDIYSFAKNHFPKKISTVDMEIADEVTGYSKLNGQYDEMIDEAIQYLDFDDEEEME